MHEADPADAPALWSLLGSEGIVTPAESQRIYRWSLAGVAFLTIVVLTMTALLS